MTNNKRLETIKNLVELINEAAETGDLLCYGDALTELYSENIGWIVEQVELADKFGRKMGELNQYLQGSSNVEDWGRNVVDVAIKVMENQAEQIKELKWIKESNDKKQVIARFKNINYSAESERFF